MRLQSFASLVSIGLFLAVPLVSVLACGPGFTEPSIGGSLDGSPTGVNPTSTGDGGPSGGPCKLERLTDLSGLTACCQDQGGQAHCLDDAKSPDTIKSKMSKCEGGGWC